MTVTINTKRLQKKFDKLLKNVNDRKTFQSLGFYIISTVRDRTRDKGQGVSRAGGRAAKLRKVSKEWAERRLRSKNRHPKAATGRTSNLTNTGTMLDNMIIKRASKKGVLIGFRNQKEEDKAQGNADRGREFMFLSGKEIRDSTDYLKSLILKNV